VVRISAVVLSLFIVCGFSASPKAGTWAPGTTIDYYLGDPPPGITAAQFRTIFETSFANWTSLGLDLSLNFSGTATPTPSNSLNNIGAVNPWPTGLGNTRTTIASTDITEFPLGRIFEADVFLNTQGFTFAIYPDTFQIGDPNPCGIGISCADLQSILMHEIGHFIGLGHLPDANATMFAVYDSGIGFRTLAAGDIAAIGELYGIEVSPVPLPATLPLYGTGLAIIGLIGWRRRRRAAATA